jgi:release factor glutamine methyltransferase
MEDEGPGQTIAGALRAAALRLREAGVEDARREAGSLLAHTLERDRAFLFTHDADALAAEKLSAFRTFVERRASGEPLQYITGRQEFYGLDFEVTPDVLIPRPETELLVELALELLRPHQAPLFCDVGTGSGCIPVAMLQERSDACALALDISPKALEVARRNALRHGVEARLRTLVSDCFDALGAGEWRGTSFPLIVSNPPYIAERDIEGLQREVREHEPRFALTPGGDGLRIIHRLVAESPRFLEPRGHLLFEIGFGQHEEVAALIDPRAWKLLDIRPDLQGIPRVAALRRTE